MRNAQCFVPVFGGNCLLTVDSSVNRTRIKIRRCSYQLASLLFPGMRKFGFYLFCMCLLS